MGIALLLIGLALVSSGIQNTQGQLGTLIAGDFSGAGSFWYFIAGLFAVGSVGYYQPLQGASRLLLGLIILVLLLNNKGFFAQLQSALNSPKASLTPASPVQPSTSNIVGQSASATSSAFPEGVPGLNITGSNLSDIGALLGVAQ